MHDAVVFVDAGQRVIHWNSGAERLTGIAGASVFQHAFSPRLLDLRERRRRRDRGRRLPRGPRHSHGRAAHAAADRAGPQPQGRHRRRAHRAGRGRDGAIHGATLLMHDVSPQISLEARCHSLHEKATKDPLTQVANRAEFDRVHEMFVAAHLERRLPCSLIICDIDHFKSVNDTYGHQAGDEVLKASPSC